MGIIEKKLTSLFMSALFGMKRSYPLFVSDIDDDALFGVALPLGVLAFGVFDVDAVGLLLRGVRADAWEMEMGDSGSLTSPFKHCFLSAIMIFIYVLYIIIYYFLYVLCCFYFFNISSREK